MDLKPYVASVAPYHPMLPALVCKVLQSHMQTVATNQALLELRCSICKEPIFA
ncbi:hypothetical protein DPMN_007935 [Dreissena polymorpha]|uniref:Uncharacterized protein n=1 Tax=Dreissena polymorpha TaxID=45954 RepID=A0A9D4RYP2_DREPO|nr:hypothetical protein DPMN_007935 [Dreissena polymorpha]